MFKVRFVTPKGLYEEDSDVSLLNIVTPDGQRGLLSNHVPIVMPLVVSKLTIVRKSSRTDFAITRGMLHFQDNVATVLVDAVERKIAIDIPRAKRAKEKALTVLEQENTDWDNERAKYALEKANNRLMVAGVELDE